MSRRVAALCLLLMQILERGGAGVHRRDPTAALEQRAHCGGPQVRLRGGGLTMHEWIILPAKDLEVVACVVHAPRV